MFVLLLVHDFLVLPGGPENRSIPCRFALGGGAETFVCLGMVLNGTALFQELFPSWLKDFGPPICPIWSYLKRPQKPTKSQHTLQIRSWRGLLTLC